MGKIPSLDLLAVLLFKQPRMLLALSAAGAGRWPTLSLLSAQTSGAFSAELSPTSQSPALTIARGYSLPVRDLVNCPCWISWGSCLSFLRPAEVPLSDSPALEHIDSSPEFGLFGIELFTPVFELSTVFVCLRLLYRFSSGNVNCQTQAFGRHGETNCW